jgi:hypothetical protein
MQDDHHRREPGEVSVCAHTGRARAVRDRSALLLTKTLLTTALDIIHVRAERAALMLGLVQIHPAWKRHMRDFCRAKGLPALRLLALGLLLVAIQGHPARAADATSNIIYFYFDLTFVLTDSESVTPNPPATYCVDIGSGDCGETGVVANFGLGENFDPGIGLIEVFGSAYATSPPPSYSEYVDGITASFFFTNYTNAAVTIDMAWNASYQLITNGTFSSASISVDYSEIDVGTVKCRCRLPKSSRIRLEAI